MARYIRVLLLLFPLALFACGLRPGHERIAAGEANLLDSLLSHAVVNGEIPGAVAFISRNGQEVFHRAYGYRDLENRIAMKKDDIFRMASMTKGLTAVAILQLYERGLLLPDDPERRGVLTCTHSWQAFRRNDAVQTDGSGWRRCRPIPDS